MAGIKTVVITPTSAHQETITNELDDLQRLVGGWIEAIQVNPNVTMWCNEEGKLKGLPINRPATELWWHLNGHARGQDVLCGTVVVTGGIGDEGETLSVNGSIWPLLQGLFVDATITD